MYRKFNSSIFVCPTCLIEQNKALLRQAHSKAGKTTTNKEKVARNALDASKKKKTPRQRAMDRADMWFSRYIRLFFSFESDGVLLGKCYTCGKIGSITSFDCGHFQRRGSKTTRFDPSNARIQCRKCNYFRSGEFEKFEINLIKEIGQEQVDYLKQLSQEIGEDNELFYREQAAKYRKLFKQLLIDRQTSDPWKRK